MKISPADKYFSRYIRIRDADENGKCHCITCGHESEPKYIQCGHYGKRQHKGTRFSEKNCHAQCGACNKWEQGNDVIFRRKLVEMYGEEQVLLLESARYATIKISKFELEQIAKHYKQKSTELAKSKNIELW